MMESSGSRTESRREEKETRRQLAQIIYEAGESGIRHEQLMRVVRDRKVGRVGFCRDIVGVLAEFESSGMIRKDNGCDEGNLPYVYTYKWVGEDLEKYAGYF